MIGELIKVEVTNGDAVLFRQFREYQDVFQHMLNAGVFETRNGVAILNFDSSGTLTEIRRDTLVYKKGLPILQKMA